MSLCGSRDSSALLSLSPSHIPQSASLRGGVGGAGREENMSARTSSLARQLCDRK